MLADVHLRSVRDVVLLLRSLPLMVGMSAEDSVLLAEHGLPRRYQPGQPVELEGPNGRRVHLLCEGTVRIEGPDYTEDSVAPDAIGFAAIIAEAPTPTAVAVTPCTTVELSADFVMQIFEDNFGFCRNALRGMCQFLLGNWDGLPKESALPEVPPICDDTLVDRLQHLSGSFLDQASLEAAVELARGAEPIAFQPGERMMREGEVARTWLSIVRGNVYCENGNGSTQVGRQMVLGVLDVMAEWPYSYSAYAVGEVLAYRHQIDRLLSVLRAHPDLTMGLLRRLAEEVLHVLAERTVRT